MIKKINHKYRKAIFVVIYYIDENNNPIYLLLKRKLHWTGWEFTKGGIEKGESKEQAAKREAYEESGLKIIKLKKFKVNGKYRYEKILKDRGDFIGQTYSLFAGEIRKGKVKFDKKEHSAFAWLDFKKAIKKLTWPNQKRCLKIVNRWLVERKLMF